MQGSRFPHSRYSAYNHFRSLKILQWWPTIKIKKWSVFQNANSGHSFYKVSESLVIQVQSVVTKYLLSGPSKAASRITLSAKMCRHLMCPESASIEARTLEAVLTTTPEPEEDSQKSTDLASPTYCCLQSNLKAWSSNMASMPLCDVNAQRSIRISEFLFFILTFQDDLCGPLTTNEKKMTC